MDEQMIKVIAVVGPTASGKTGLAVEIAKALDGEVVSADSMQIYKGMDIATAKPTAEEMQGVPHHLISFLEPCCAYSVADYVRDAQAVIADIHRRGRLPIVAGGTGLYVDALIKNMDFDAVLGDDSLKKQLQEELSRMGPAHMHQRLMALDPDLAVKLHPNNTGRVLRALECCILSGKSMTELQRQAVSRRPLYDCRYIGIAYRDRQLLYDRIDRRVDQMAQTGLVGEALDFYSKQSEYRTAAQAIGYKELRDYFDGEDTLQQCLENLKRRTHNYAKRQLTWFRRNPDICWITADEKTPPQIAAEAIAFCREHLAGPISPTGRKAHV